MGPRFEPSSKSCPGLGQWGSSPRPDRPNVTPVCYICKLIYYSEYRSSIQICAWAYVLN